MRMQCVYLDRTLFGSASLKVKDSALTCEGEEIDMRETRVRQSANNDLEKKKPATPVTKGAVAVLCLIHTAAN